jgi:2'-5' RNA ligase
MHGIVSLFDSNNDGLVKSVWKDLERTFKIRGVYRTPYPHFSYHIASDYQFDKLNSILKGIAKKQGSFAVTAGGLGVFTGPAPVLYIPVARTLELSRLHETLLAKIGMLSVGASTYYNPEFWMPHITLGMADLSQAELPRVVAHLNRRKTDLHIKVDNLAVIREDGGSQAVSSRFLFEGSP